MAKIVLFGTGKVADVVAHHIEESGQHEIVAFTTDADYVPDDGTFHGKPVIAFEGIEAQYSPQQYGMLVAIGYHDLNAVRKAKYEEAKGKGYKLVSYISPRAAIGNWRNHGENCIVLDAVVEPGTRLGNNVIVWSGVLVGHHTTILDHAWIAGQAIFGGSAILGERCFVGLGAIVGHEVEIGAECFIGAGALVTKCCDPKSVFIAQATEKFRLDSERFLRISKLR